MGLKRHERLSLQGGLKIGVGQGTWTSTLSPAIRLRQGAHVATADQCSYHLYTHTYDQKANFKALIHLVKLGQLCILIFDRRPWTVIQCDRNKERGHIETEQLLLLCDSQRGVDCKEVEVLGEVTPVLGHLTPEESKDGEKQVVGEARLSRHLNRDVGEA